MRWQARDVLGRPRRARDWPGGERGGGSRWRPCRTLHCRSAGGMGGQASPQAPTATTTAASIQPHQAPPAALTHHVGLAAVEPGHMHAALAQVKVVPAGRGSRSSGEQEQENQQPGGMSSGVSGVGCGTTATVPCRYENIWNAGQSTLPTPPASLVEVLAAVPLLVPVELLHEGTPEGLQGRQAAAGLDSGGGGG